MTNPSESQNLEPRVARNEESIRDLQTSISDLKSTVSTLADVIAAEHDQTRDRRIDSRFKHKPIAPKPQQIER